MCSFFTLSRKLKGRWMHDWANHIKKAQCKRLGGRRLDHIVEEKLKGPGRICSLTNATVCISCVFLVFHFTPIIIRPRSSFSKN
jgi:hypothetical protein